MGNRRNVITLNGNKYDAVTGELITPVTKEHNHLSRKTSTSIDGLTVSKKQTTSPKHTTRTALKSKTLMRSVVRKPEVKNKAVQSSKTTISSQSFTNPSRENRAKNITKSSLISKFNFGDKDSKRELAHIEVAQPPHHSSNHATQNPSLPTKSRSTPTKSARKDNALIEALQNSQSHTNTKTKKHSRRQKVAKKLKISTKVLNISLALFAVIIMGGYFAYNNVPNLAMKVASTRSGTPGALPGYRPSGFALGGPIKYNPGQIQISYKSNTDNRSFTITETKSEWNSDALLDNHVAINSRSYQTFQDNNRTIYIYDGDVASWVDNGIWYELNGNQSLNTDQILRIANSL